MQTKMRAAGLIHCWGSAFAACLLIGSAGAGAAIIQFQTPPGAQQNLLPVNAKATFTTSANTLQILLENLQADPKSVVECLSGLQFTVSGFTSGTLASSSGLERNIAANGSFADASNQPTGWALSTVGSDLKLNLLGTATAPTHTIIGPPDGTNVYGNANNSITNGVHSPFLALSATFDISVPGMTSSTLVSAATFQFNTDPGSTTPATLVPEPVTTSMLVLGVLGLIRRRRIG